MNKASPAPEGIWNRIFSLNLAVSVLSFMSIYMLLPTLPVYAQTLGGSETIAGAIVGLFMFSAVLVRPWFGNLVDQKGRKLILVFGLVISLISIIAYNIAFYIVILMALRLIHGIGWAAANTAGWTIAADVVPSARRVEGMGFFGVASTVAITLGPALGLYLINHSSFTILFTVASIFATVGLAGSLFINYENNPEKREKQADTPALKAVILEKAAIAPSLVWFFIALTYGGIVSFLPSYAYTRGVQNIGLFFTVYAIILLVSRPTIGKLADRYGARRFLAPGILVTAASLVLLAKASSLPVFLFSGIIYGIGFATLQPILIALAASLAPPERRGSAQATFGISMDLGIGLGSIILGFIIQTAGYAYLYISAAGFALLALIMYYAILHKKLPR